MDGGVVVDKCVTPLEHSSLNHLHDEQSEILCGVRILPDTEMEWFLGMVNSNQDRRVPRRVVQSTVGGDNHTLANGTQGILSGFKILMGTMSSLCEG